MEAEEKEASCLLPLDPSRPELFLAWASQTGIPIAPFNSEKSRGALHPAE
jgi:hypothetical protein